MLNEFKKFALRGNVIDLAVAVIIGAAFSRIVASLVDDMIMPVIGAMTGGLDFTSYYTQLTGGAMSDGTPLAQAKQAGAVLAWGNFLTVTVNFLIITFVLFLAIRAINKLRETETASEPAKLSTQEQLLIEIRDLLQLRAETR